MRAKVVVFLRFTSHGATTGPCLWVEPLVHRLQFPIGTKGCLLVIKARQPNEYCSSTEGMLFMWKMIFAVVAMSSLAFGEVEKPVLHGDEPVSTAKSQPTQQAAPDNSANALLKLDACLKQRPGTGGSLDELLKKATTR